MQVKLSLFLCGLAVGVTLAFTEKEESIVNYAVDQLGDGYYLIRIKSVESQVVRGTMYYVEAKVGYQIPGGISEKYNCHFEVWERPHGRKTVEESTCT